MDSKRSYFTSDEKIYLKELVNKYKDVIECKRTDCISVADKKRTWCLLSKEFNAISEHNSRTTEQLKKCWDNMKNRRKKELAEEKKQRMATGGGSYVPPPQDHQTDDILSNIDIEITDTVDSDAIALVEGIPQQSIARADENLETEEEIHIVVEKGTPSRSRSEVTNEHLTPGSFWPTRKRIAPSYTSRGTAIERELEVRLQRNHEMQRNEQELHALRIQEQELRIEEQQLKIAEQKIRNKIAMYELEIIKKKFENDEIN